MRILKSIMSLLAVCVLFQGCSQVISDSKNQSDEQTKEMYVLTGVDHKIVLNETQQKKLSNLLSSWDYSNYVPQKEQLYGGLMFRIVVVDSSGETIWLFGENGISINSINENGVFEPIVKYGADEALFRKVKNIVYEEDVQ